MAEKNFTCYLRGYHTFSAVLLCHRVYTMSCKLLTLCCYCFLFTMCSYNRIRAFPLRHFPFRMSPCNCCLNVKKTC